MQIISVTPLDKRRSKVLTDEDFAFALYQGEIKAYKIKEGGELTGEVYWEILEKVLFKRAKERTLYLLKSRDRTELESFHPQYVISHPEEVFEKILV